MPATMADRPTLADLAANPALAAEVALDRIPEVLGEIERPRAALWARLMMQPRARKATILSYHPFPSVAFLE